jgi:hypothetical protein
MKFANVNSQISLNHHIKRRVAFYAELLTIRPKWYHIRMKLAIPVSPIPT